jgi:hypothetical protein
MTTLAINDLALGNDLDNAAMAQLTGRGREWEQRSVNIYTSGWSNYSRLSSSYLGQVMKHGYLHKKYAETFKRTRTQTEISSWYRYEQV